MELINSRKVIEMEYNIEEGILSAEIKKEDGRYFIGVYYRPCIEYGIKFYLMGTYLDSNEQIEIDNTVESIYETSINTILYTIEQIHNGSMEMESTDVSHLFHLIEV